MSKHKMKAFCPFGLQPDSLEVEIEFEYRPGRPAVMYLRNGDPGYPADPPEIDMISATLVHHKIDDSMQGMLDEWASEYLSGEGYDKAIDMADDDR
jgi:hypothetical protein